MHRLKGQISNLRISSVTITVYSVKTKNKKRFVDHPKDKRHKNITPASVNFHHILFCVRCSGDPKQKSTAIIPVCPCTHMYTHSRP